MVEIELSFYYNGLNYGNQSLEIQKVGLCCYDNKRYLLDDGITSYSYGHYKIS
jgi:hypothetical protein